VLEPYPAERFEIEGIPVLLPQKAVVSFSLAIYELATNAAKYGALSVAQGKVSISWAFGTVMREQIPGCSPGGLNTVVPQ
jgi:two-component sensor histidine kinase